VPVVCVGLGLLSVEGLHCQHRCSHVSPEQECSGYNFSNVIAVPEKAR